MRTIWFYVCLVLSLLPFQLKTRKMKALRETMDEREFIELADVIIQKWAYKQVKNTGANVIISGEENIPKDKAVVFISNHQSNFDIGIFLGVISKPKGYIAKTETLKIPIIRTWMTFINCVFMDRDDMKNQAKAIIDGINHLKSGHSMVIFPEGTRSQSGTPGEFKAGSFKLATKSLCDIIPVTIDGSYKVIEANKNRIKPATVYVTIHPAVATKDLPREELNKLPEIVKDIIIGGLRN